MKPMNPVVWFEIYVDDIERARKFYETVLDTKMEDLPTPETPDGDSNMKMVAFPMVNEGEGAAGAIVKMEGFGPGGCSTVVYFGSAGLCDP